MAAGNVTRIIEDNDALASLEERILRAVQLVNQLRSEKEAAEAQILAARTSGEAELEALRAENARLLDEVAELRAERKQVRTRIEKLLGQMDNLAG
jgi:seryl-tRNA synthetase